ncbi:NAD-dependent succinate-semialdehyde dehydrogenase [Brachybacterium sp. EF45031]|uniref:NAD-dependent succinate-semialdehyde dehydrogenase n=1 Tax=Brachybacterium sillae TaxID=2810536 RepID=UPI00217EE0EE|nr:NAD-dependent succinate-semialdehyde dehydrogenase [Brachybacterium sillae]MCS6711704.1 NAD-dependent succinate-semialdehyde dehydrogenase [Brachybacterium sillae]
MPDLPTITPETVADLVDRLPRSSWIGGRWIHGRDGSDRPGANSDTDRPGAASGTAVSLAAEDLAVEDPATGETLVTIAAASDGAAAGLAALDAAAEAQASWAATTPRERSDILRRAFELLHARADDLALTMTLEMGKPLAEGYGEVSYGAEFLRWFSEEAVRTPGRLRPAPAAADQLMFVDSRPVGPCLLITPWNFPLSMGTRKIGPALAAGCTVVLKPAGMTPLSSLLLVEILEEAGVPHGVVNCVVTPQSKEMSAAVMADPRLRKVSFTGSTPVGKGLLRQAAEHVLRTSMELGGNAPFLVLPSADLDVAAEAARLAKWRNNGEACTAANRFYVHSSVAEEFTRRLAQVADSLVEGPGIEPESTLGPVISAKALSEMQELVDDAVERGARIVTGGEALDRPGHFYPATVLADVPADARVCREEIFGPIAPVVVMDDVDEMIAAANSTEFGLMSYVMAEDHREIARAVRGIASGMVAVNVGVASDPAAPFGGVKESGVGREGSHEGLAEYLETTYVRMAL